MNPKDKPEYKALSTNQADLQRHVGEHLTPIADRLRDLEILIPDQHEEILVKKTSGQQGAQQLVKIVMQTIETDPESYYYLFVDVLKRVGNVGLKTFVEDTLEASRRRFYQDVLQQTGDANPTCYDVFISYGRENETTSFAENLYDHLQEQGLSVFMDTKSMAPGDQWQNTISHAIHSAKVFIALLTKKYVKSRYCKSELYVAEAEGKSVFPVVYQDGWESGTLGQSVKMVVEKNNYAWFQPSRRDYGKQLSSLTSSIMRRFNKSPNPPPSYSCKKSGVYVTAMLVLPLLLAGLGYWYVYGAGPVACVALPSLDNGSVTYSPDETGPDYDLGTVATHTCQDGFTLHGNSELTCDNWFIFGRWSSRPPFCQGTPSSNKQHQDARKQPRSKGSSHKTKDHTQTGTIDPGAVPELPLLLNFECICGKKIDVVAKTALKYRRFGILLLMDHTGSTVANIARAKGPDPVDITTEIFSRWLEGTGLEPRSWLTLVNCLRDIELNTVANEIEKMFIIK